MSGRGTVAERYRAARRDRGLAVLEGLHALKHALRFGATILDVRARDPERLGALARELAPDVADRVMELAHATDDDDFDTLAPSPHPTGVIALARRPPLDLARVLAGDTAAPIVLLERPTHHGNIGAVVRVSAAAGAAAVLVTGPHDPWHPSSIRGGAGLQFALPVASLAPAGGSEPVGRSEPRAMDTVGPEHAVGPVGAVLESARSVVVLDPEGETLAPGAAGLPAGCVLVFGSERTGVSASLLDRADRRVSIPMRAGVSSLNLATAVAVTLYLAGAGDASWERP